MPTDSQASHDLRERVREGYAKVAETGALAGAAPSGGCCSGGGGATPATDPVAFASSLGYAAEDLALLPEGSNMGLSCGNPAAIAALQPGQVLVDLGSGGGLDCFLAGPKLGPSGRAIGVDMTAEMVRKARQGVAAYRARSGLDNVEFRLGEIEHLPLADQSADVVLSNCVINLSPDKAQVWSEIARVLRPGGQVAISDVALKQPLPDAIRPMAEALIGCVAGAVLIEDYRNTINAAGFEGLEIRENPSFVAAVVAGDDPLYAPVLAQLPPGTELGDYVTSLSIRARKPKASCCGG